MLAASQWGMFTSTQAQNAGVGRTQLARMHADGRIENLTTGVYRFVAGEETSHSDIKAYWMSVFPRELAFERLKKVPPDAVVAGRTAAYLHGIGDMYAAPYTFLVIQRKQTSRKDLRFLQWEIEECDMEIIDGLPVTSVERTIADLVRLREDPSLTDDVVRDAIREKGIDSQRLAWLLSPLAARNGFGRGNGRAFANDLILRNSDFSEVISKALDPLRSVYANMDAFQKPLKDITHILSETAREENTDESEHPDEVQNS